MYAFVFVSELVERMNHGSMLQALKKQNITQQLTAKDERIQNYRCLRRWQLVYEHLARQLEPAEAAIATYSLGLKTNKKLLVIHITEKTEKIVTLRDLSNLHEKHFA